MQHFVPLNWLTAVVAEILAPKTNFDFADHAHTADNS
jgi:hypothetical protein